MDFISSSQDILFLVLAFCTLWLTVLLTWLLYYLITAVRQIYQVVRAAKAKLDAVDEIVRLIKDKVTSGASYLTMLVSGILKVTDLLGNREKPSKKSKR